MISIFHLIRGDLVLAPMAILFWVSIRSKIRVLSLQVNEIPEGAQNLFGYKVGSYLCLLAFCIALTFWIGAIVEVRFDWSRSDVAEIEVSVFQSPDPAAKPTRVVNITDDKMLNRLFDSLAALKSFQSSGHEHAVGQCFTLRLRRNSDRQWSSYRVRIYPESEPIGGAVRLKGVYKMRFEVGPGKYYFGKYQAIELGRLVEQLVVPDSE
jgi:hypothetical protein